MAADPEFVRQLWSAVTSRRIQFRMLKSYLGYREVLMRLGADVQMLPLTPDLEASQAAPTREGDQEEGESLGG